MRIKFIRCKKKKEKLPLALRRKTIPFLRKRLTEVFNKYIRLRDKDKLCISCGENPVQQAGHYHPTSRCPQGPMRFCEKNVNGQCINCNKWLEGNRQGYEKGLIEKYGIGIIEELQLKRSIKQNPWKQFEYETLIEHYKKKVTELEERQ